MPIPSQEENVMCNTHRATEDKAPDVRKEKDVDDLIFRDERDWQTSDR